MKMGQNHPWLNQKVVQLTGLVEVTQDYKNLSPVTGADGISGIKGEYRGTAETVTREPAISSLPSDSLNSYYF